MLILTRSRGQIIKIGEDIKVQLIEIQGKQARIGIEAPRRLAVHRQEVYERIQAEGPRRRFRRLFGIGS